MVWLPIKQRFRDLVKLLLGRSTLLRSLNKVFLIMTMRLRVPPQSNKGVDKRNELI